MLLEWLSSAEARLEELGYEARLHHQGQPGPSTAVDVDSSNFVGTITHWPPDKFEFQFNACDSGHVVILEIASIQTHDVLAGHIEALLGKLKVQTEG